VSEDYGEASFVQKIGRRLEGNRLSDGCHYDVSLDLAVRVLVDVNVDICPASFSSHRGRVGLIVSTPESYWGISMGYVKKPEKKEDKRKPGNPEDEMKTGSRDLFQPEEHNKMIKKAEDDKLGAVETTRERIGEKTPTGQGPEILKKQRKEEAPDRKH